jgi:hypothetical protein
VRGVVHPARGEVCGGEVVGDDAVMMVMMVMNCLRIAVLGSESASGVRNQHHLSLQMIPVQDYKPIEANRQAKDSLYPFQQSLGT